MITFVLVLILMAIFALPFVLERKKPAVSNEQRRASDYRFAQLSNGVTAYRWHGGARGPVIVAVHGLTTPSAVWDELIPHLTGMGYRVVTYDLYGRGLSDTPQGRQTAAFFQRQLRELLDYLKLEQDVTLMGYSMGGAIVTGFSATYRYRVDRIILVASAGIKLNETLFERVCRSVPGLGDWLGHLFLPGRLRNGLRGSKLPIETKTLLEHQVSQRGYISSVLSSRRYQLSDQQRSEHRVLQREQVQVLAIWGDQDDIIPIVALGQLSQWNRNAQQDVIKGAGHELLATHTDEVFASIRSLLIS